MKNITENPELIFEDNEPVIVFWDSIPFNPSQHWHDIDCDKCTKPTGNLIDIPFLYLDCNDHIHKDEKPPQMYHQYKVCIECWKKEI